MRKLIYNATVSLDGFIARSNGDLDWHIIDEEIHKFVNEKLSHVGAFLHGRRMYELMVDYWPTADQDPSAPEPIVEFAHIWRSTPKIVFSKTLDRVEWNSTLVKGDAGAEIRRLKAEPGKPLCIGGSMLAETAFRQGLVDEYYLYVDPLILGEGMPLFPALDESVDLRLVETHVFTAGVVFLHYARKENGQHV